MTTEQEIQKAIERARRWDGRAHCELEGCTHFATLEHVTAHIERIREGERR